MKLLQTFLLTITLLFSYTAFADKININTATAEEISSAMSGIGESKARAIVEYRKNNGKFKTLESIQEVDGVGAKTLEKNRDKITL